jgi:glutamate 5-kinase
LLEKGASLLPSGIIAVQGKFVAGEAVNIEFNQQLIAKGLVLYNAVDLQQIKGLKSSAIEATLGFSVGEAAIHRDDLVLI